MGVALKVGKLLIFMGFLAICLRMWGWSTETPGFLKEFLKDFLVFTDFYSNHEIDAERVMQCYASFSVGLVVLAALEVKAAVYLMILNQLTLLAVLWGYDGFMNRELPLLLILEIGCLLLLSYENSILESLNNKEQ